MNRCLSVLGAVVLVLGGCDLYFSNSGDGSSGSGASGGGSVGVPGGPGVPPSVPPSVPSDPIEGDAPAPDSVVCEEPVGEPTILNCETDTVYTWRSSEIGDTTMHLVGIYETHPDHSGGNHPMGYAAVRFERFSPGVLVLSSYEPVTWEVSMPEGAGLQKIVAIGYHEQIVRPPPGVEVEIFDFVGGSSGFEWCGYSLPSNSGGCETEALITDAMAVTGLPLSSFDG